MEASDIDDGGYGIVATKVNDDMAAECLSVGCRPGLTITRFNGAIDNLRHPDRELKRCIPFTKQPNDLFKNTWSPVAWGRWQWADHITLGESRAVLVLLQRLAREGSAHRHKSCRCRKIWPPPARTQKEGRQPRRSTTSCANDVL